MKRTFLVFLCFTAYCLASAAQTPAEVDAVLKQFPITFQVEKSDVQNLVTDQQQLAKAAAIGIAPPVFGFFSGALNGERHWHFGCQAESAPVRAESLRRFADWSASRSLDARPGSAPSYRLRC